LNLYKMLYFIGLMPPLPLRAKIQEMKMDFKENYDSSHALNSPPHITLIPPFRITDEPTAKELLQNFANEHSSFEVELKDFSHFGKRVIFIDVVESQFLNKLHQGLKKVMSNHSLVFEYASQPKPYHPHLTLAFKDLSNENFRRAWAIYNTQSYNASFETKELVLFKHYQQKWHIDGKFEFGKG